MREAQQAATDGAVVVGMRQNVHVERVDRLPDVSDGVRRQCARRWRERRRPADRWRRAVSIADKASEQRELSLQRVNDIDWHALCTTESTRTCDHVASR
ncbi:MAG TPA: hypothetical protein VKU81_05415, partial [Casimicrobiaceae bacterium]|nr:hypothetical protein [Casimicrobiaceae bacterium]